MQIRTFRESDAEGVTALWHEVFPDNPAHSAPAVSIRLKLALQPELFFVAEVGPTLVGTVLAGYDGHRGWLYAVAVSPRHQRQGIGRALVRHAEAALAALGCPKINLQVRTSNAAVVTFYQALGYRVEERISMGKLLARPEP
jgi:ribosomal protein S18 acetylase RimI-like enzyme